MSHVTTIEVEINDLIALAQAAKRCGCELVRDKKTYHWYGDHVGDHPLPEGVTVEQLGKCDHAIRVANAASANPYEKPYEIGVVAKPGGGYRLLYDFFAGGYGLMEKVSHVGRYGEKPDRLVQEYAAAAAERKLKRQGYRVRRETADNGEIRLIAR